MARARAARAPKRDDDRTARALARFRAVLRQRELRMTPVREAIVRQVMAFDGHFDIRELTRTLQDTGVRDASMATVYRVMPLLVDAGLAQPALLSGSEGHRYEASFEREHHDHLICTSCGKVIEFHFEAFEVLQQDLAARYDFELTHHVHELLGVCGACRKKAPKAP